MQRSPYVRALALTVSFALITTSCKPTKSGSGLEDAVATSSTQSMCLSIQGNGTNFPSHLGIITALLERNLDPSEIGGASSGSMVTPFIRFLTSNQSIINTSATDSVGRVLSTPQKSARVLSAISPVLENFLFLPATNRGMAFLGSLIEYYLGTVAADAFLGGPQIVIAHLESASGQAAMVMSFLRDADFSGIVQEPDIKNRTAMMQTMWLKAGNFIYVSSSDFANAMLTPSNAPQFTPNFAEIRRRYFAIFRTEVDPPGGAPADLQAAYDAKLQSHSTLLNLISADRKASLFMSLLKTVRVTPIVGSLAVLFIGSFYMVDPDLVWSAYKGNDLQGKPMYVPQNVVIHSTALNDDGQAGSFTDRPGRNNLYQGYFVDRDTGTQLQAARSAVAAGRGFLEYPTSSGYGTLIDAQHTFIVNNPLLIDAIKPSIAEPDTMRRTAIAFDPSDGPAGQGLNLAGGTLVGYGGWLEHVSLETLGRLNKCQAGNVDYYVHITNGEMTDGMPVIPFQVKAMRGAIEGMAALETVKTPLDSSVAPFFNDLGNFINYAKSLKGTNGTVAMTFDWNFPSTAPQADQKAMISAIQAFHSGMLLVGYQYADKLLSTLPGIPNDAATRNLAFGDLSSYDFASAPDDQTLHRLVGSVLFK